MRIVLLLPVLGTACLSGKQAWPGRVASGPVSLARTPSTDGESATTREPPPPIPGEPCVRSAEPVRMDLVRADVRQVLQALADRGDINLVLADDVSGRVTVRLEDVPLERALVTIAHAAGLELDTSDCITAVSAR